VLDPDALRELGFEGFAKLSEALATPSILPTHVGTYVVFRPTLDDPFFLSASPAGWFKGMDPSYHDSQLLRSKWVPAAHVVYIGKAGPSQNRHLQRRIGELLRFGKGSAAAHRGGRALWHLKEVWSYSLAWKRCRSDPRGNERKLIAQFEALHGKLPFANFVR
jgi:hypothetical protein